MRVVLLALCASAIPVSAQTFAQHYRLNIPREALDAALEDFARQTHLQIARFSDTVDGSVIVGPVTGEFSAEAALQSLLAPRGLSFKVVNATTVVVVNGDQK